MNSTGSRLEPSIGFQRKVLMGGWINCKPEQNMVKKNGSHKYEFAGSVEKSMISLTYLNSK